MWWCLLEAEEDLAKWKGRKEQEAGGERPTLVEGLDTQAHTHFESLSPTRRRCNSTGNSRETKQEHSSWNNDISLQETDRDVQLPMFAARR